MLNCNRILANEDTTQVFNIRILNNLFCKAIKFLIFTKLEIKFEQNLLV